jgi:hypothetical protein
MSKLLSDQYDYDDYILIEDAGAMGKQSACCA